MTQYSNYPIQFAPSMIDYDAEAALIRNQRFDPEARSMPTLLGIATGLYLASVALFSTASASTAWIPQAVGALLGVLWVAVGVFAKGQPLAWSKPIMLFVAFTAWSTTGLIVTADTDYFMQIYMTSIKVMGITWIASQCVRTRKDLLVCCFILCIAAVVVLVQGIDTIIRSVQFSAGKDIKGARASGTLLSNANDLGEFGVLVAIASVACLLGYKSILLRLCTTVSLVSALYIVAASGSRMAMLNTLIVAVSLYWYHFRKAGGSDVIRKVLIVCLAMVVLAGSMYYVSNLPFFYRLIKTFSSYDAMQDEPRFQYFISAIIVTIQNPIIGLGQGGFALAGLGRTAEGVAHFSHSTISETLSCTGIPGFLLYFSGRFAFLFLLLRTRKLPLPQRDFAVVNLIVAFFWVNILFDIVAMTFQHRLMWPMIGAACGYLWQLNRTYGSASVQTEYA